jgi:sugar phosphate isomerase/epimerase
VPRLARREFLARAALAAATGPWFLHAAASRAGALSLGFSLYGMKTLSIAEAVAACARIGYRNVELPLMAGFPLDPAKLDAATRAAARANCRAAGLPVSSLIVNLALAVDDATHARHLATLRQAAQFARELDSVAPPVVQTVMGGRPATWDADQARMSARLRDWDAIAGEHGVTVAVKAHVGSAVNSPARLLWLLREAEARHVAVAYDSSHFALGGLAPAESFPPLASRTRFVHLKDATADPAGYRFLLPGEGTMDFRALFRLLAESGYRGAVVVEVSSQIFNRPGYDPIVAAERSHAALAPALAG